MYFFVLHIILQSVMCRQCSSYSLVSLVPQPFNKLLITFAMMQHQHNIMALTSSLVGRGIVPVELHFMYMYLCS